MDVLAGRRRLVSVGGRVATAHLSRAALDLQNDIFQAKNESNDLHFLLKNHHIYV